MRVAVCRLEDLWVGTGLRAPVVDRPPITVFRTESGVYAVDDTCPHAGGSLCEGWVEGDHVVCPINPGEFHLPTGRAVCFPAEADLRTYPVAIEDDQVIVEIPTEG